VITLHRRFAAIVLLLGLAPVPALAKLEATYVVLGPEGAVARAILTGATQCPTITIGDAAQPMNVRAMPETGASPAFPVLVCELLIPAEAKSAAIEEQSLPLPKTSLGAIAALGDTGCRLKGKKAKGSDQEQHDHGAGKFQDCDSQSKWPFARVAASIAAAVPDFVIHVGDYVYRESACPGGNMGCKGSPHGDTWQTWKADFFDPARPLLQAAPWIMTRGNHENCARAGSGYFRFLAPSAARDELTSGCIDRMPIYAVNVGGKSFIVMDTSNADDACAQACGSGPYADDFASMKLTRGTWWVSHRPVWGIVKNSSLNATLQQALKAWNGRLPDGIELALSGHIHSWQLLSFADGRSPQLIVGNGGTLRDKINRRVEGQKIGGTTVSYGRLEHSFGYTILRPSGGDSGWAATFFDAAGRAKFTCMLKATAASCG